MESPCEKEDRVRSTKKEVRIFGHHIPCLKPLSYLKECPFHPPFLEYLTNEKYW
jgi:hypothetical protein